MVALGDEEQLVIHASLLNCQLFFAHYVAILLISSQFFFLQCNLKLSDPNRTALYGPRAIEIKEAASPM